MTELPDPWLALQVVMLPKDANPLLTVYPGQPHGPVYCTVFGGVILSHIDMAGAVAADRELKVRGGNPNAVFVTVAITRVEFKKPVLVGDVVRFLTQPVRLGRTSVTVHVNVVVERGRETIPVTEAEVVYVAVDPGASNRRPVPLFPLSPESQR